MDKNFEKLKEKIGFFESEYEKVELEGHLKRVELVYKRARKEAESATFSMKKSKSELEVSIVGASLWVSESSALKVLLELASEVEVSVESGSIKVWAWYRGWKWQKNKGSALIKSH